jgi:hypothetical protein
VLYYLYKRHFFSIFSPALARLVPGYLRCLVLAGRAIGFSLFRYSSLRSGTPNDLGHPIVTFVTTVIR